jgi:hypothetical protein
MVGSAKPSFTEMNARSSRHEHIFRNQLRAMPNAMREVNTKHGDGGSTNRCSAD